MRGDQLSKAVGTMCALAVAASVGLAPSPARAQVGENQLVQAPDGSLYVFERGELHPIAPVPVTAPQLLGLPLGSEVTEGVTIINLRPPRVADPAAPTEVAGNPADGLLGQRAVYCYQNVDVAMEVVRTDWVRLLGNRTAPATATWLVVLFDATPQGGRGIGPAFNDQFSGLEVQDDRGRVFRPADSSVSSAAADVHGGASNTSGGITAGAPARLIRAFEVTSDAQALTFTGGRVGCN